MVRKRHINLALRAAIVSGAIVGAAGCAGSGPADRAAAESSSTATSAASSASAVAAPEAQLGIAPHAAATGTIPGTERAIQQWFLRVDKAKIAFDNALFRAEQGVANHVSSDCQALQTSVRRMVAELPGLTNASPAGARIAAAISPVMSTMAALAKDCLAGDWTAAANDMNIGIPQQANSQALVDEILDGDR